MSDRSTSPLWPWMFGKWPYNTVHLMHQTLYIWCINPNFIENLLLFYCKSGNLHILWNESKRIKEHALPYSYCPTMKCLTASLVGQPLSWRESLVHYSYSRVVFHTLDFSACVKWSKVADKSLSSNSCTYTSTVSETIFVLQHLYVIVTTYS